MKKEIWALAGGHLKAPRMLLLKAGFAPPEAKSSSNVLMKVLTRLWSDNADRRVWTDPNNTARAPQQLLYIEYTRISGTHREHCPKKKQKKHLHESVFSPGLVHSPWDAALNPRSRIRKTKLTHSIEQRRGGGQTAACKAANTAGNFSEALRSSTLAGTGMSNTKADVPCWHKKKSWGKQETQFQ